MQLVGLNNKTYASRQEKVLSKLASITSTDIIPVEDFHDSGNIKNIYASMDTDGIDLLYVNQDGSFIPSSCRYTTLAKGFFIRTNRESFNAVNGEYIKTRRSEKSTMIELSELQRNKIYTIIYENGSNIDVYILKIADIIDIVVNNKFYKEEKRSEEYGNTIEVATLSYVPLNIIRSKAIAHYNFNIRDCREVATYSTACQSSKEYIKNNNNENIYEISYNNHTTTLNKIK